VFGVDRKTLQRWGQALLMPDAESSIQALRSRSEPRKLTVEVRKFAEIRFGVIYQRNRTSYSSQIRREIFETFGVSISPECLRPIFTACRQRLTTGNTESKKKDSGSDSGDGETDGEADGESNCDDSVKNVGGTGIELNIATTIEQHQCPPTDEDTPQIVRYVHHAGVLIFSWCLSQIQTLHILLLRKKLP
jgi:hypothetical protein